MIASELETSRVDRGHEGHAARFGRTGHVEHVGQGITLVDPAHRGHRLGLLTKIENLRYALDEFPGMRYIDTWNATVNAHMISINERMGFRPVDAWFDWQMDV